MLFSDSESKSLRLKAKNIYQYDRHRGQLRLHPCHSTLLAGLRRFGKFSVGEVEVNSDCLVNYRKILIIQSNLAN